MNFDRERLPEPMGYYEAKGLCLTGPGKWRTATCVFHGGTDSMRINTQTGAWVCMACGEKGGDVLAYEMASTGVEFVDAAKALGAWIDDGKSRAPQKPAPLPPRAALQVLAFEAMLTAVAAGNIAHGVKLKDADRLRLLAAANRITRLVEAYS